MERETENVLHRLFGSPKPRAAEPQPARTLANLKLPPDCAMTERDYAVIRKALTTWAQAATIAIEHADRLARVGKKNVPDNVWNENMALLNEVLDAIETLQPLVDKCVKYAAKLTLLEQAVVRCYDAVDDHTFSTEIAGELAAAFQTE